MLKKSRSLCLAVVVGITVLPIAYAHHGEHHEEHHTPPVVSTSSAATMVQPPVVQPPAVQPAVSNFVAPAFKTPNITLPTDIAGLRSGVDANKFAQVPPLKPGDKSSNLSKQELAELSAPDPRYVFTGKWYAFASDYGTGKRDSSAISNESVLEPKDLSAASNDDKTKLAVQSETNTPQNDSVAGAADSSVSSVDVPVMQFGKIEHIEKHPPRSKEAAFVPVKNATFSKINDEHMMLKSGAVLVRAGNTPVFVSAAIHGEKVLAKVASGALAMVSMYDDKVTVLELTDRCCGALVLYVPSNTGKMHSVIMKPGQIAEVYAPDDKPISNLLATKIDTNQRIGHNYGLLISQCHYVRALKKFQLLKVLTDDDLSRVMKTAAALAHVRRVLN